MDECYICLEQLDRNIAVLNCGHKYHFDCISSWVNKTNKWRRICAVCQDTDTEIISIQNVVKNVEELNIEQELYSNPNPNKNPTTQNSISNNRSRYYYDLFCCNIL